MRGARTLSTALILGGALLISGGAALAQEATPGGIDLSPNPEQCTQVPRTLEAIEALVGTPVPSQTEGMAADGSPAPVELPIGEPAPKEAIDGVVATIVENVACFNAGNYLAQFGGMTDAYLLSQIESGAIDQSIAATVAATPAALAEDQQTQLLDTRDFALYPDGRVGVLVYYKAPSTPLNANDDVRIELWIFRDVDGRWLLDETITGLEEQLRDMATPAAG
jgi:hypothetical protein